MLTLDRRADPGAQAAERVVLPFDLRCRSRLLVTLESGREAAVMLPRGERLRDGDRLLAADGTVVAVAAAPERLLEARAADPFALCRAAYHLGNRHVPVQVLPGAEGGCLRFQADHVLAQMLQGLGLEVAEVTAPFEPEAGAYGEGGHRHGDPHDPGHGPHRSVPRIHEFR